jgi:hypothetical protein
MTCCRRLCLRFGLLVLGAWGLAGAWVPAARALESFDFETPYLVHPGQQVWDFSLVRDNGQYHVFYHTVPQQVATAARADTIWHAASPDLRHWNLIGPVLAAGPDWYDRVAMWAPAVVWDPATSRWAMLYTGVTDGMVQRPCLAWSDDLQTWTKSPANPVFTPDSLTYHWTPTQAWSSFRDPFVFHDGSRWNMLSTAGLRLGGYPGYRRGIVHRAVSPDLENWTDAGVFYQHDGAVGRTRDLESVQYVVRDGWHHLFFVEQDLEIENHPTSHLVAADPSGWTMTARTVVDAGWAPEINRFDAGEGDVFARLAKGQDPRDGSWFVTAKFDSVRFADGGLTPVVISADALQRDWTVQSGALFTIFGENAVLRNEGPLGIEGHGWISTFENYGGPLSGEGAPGAARGDGATGRIESRPFVVTGGHLRLLVAGGYYPASCYVALLADGSGAELARLAANNTNQLGERLWNLGPWLGQSVRLAIVDEEAGPGGWIAVDGIEERTGDLAAAGEVGPRGATAADLRAWPNPFNPQTEIRFTAQRPGRWLVAVYDLAGRAVWRSPGISVSARPEAVRLVWDGHDQHGRALPSGAFVAQVEHDGVPAASLRLLLLK